MGITCTVRSRSRAAGIIRNLRAQTTAGLDNGAQAAGRIQKGLITGSYTAYDLARMGHPYARKAGAAGNAKDRAEKRKMRGSLPRLPINDPNNRVRDTQNITLVTPGPDVQARDIGFAAWFEPYILSPDGTKYMVPRDFWVAFVKQAKSPFFNAMRKAWIGALRGG